MASIYQLKPAFQNLLRPLVKSLAAVGITANQVTVFAALLSALCAIAIARFSPATWTFFIVPVLLFVRMALNAIDGMLAREFNMKTNLGMFLNELGDVFADSFVYLAFAWFPGIPPWPLVIFVILAIISEMTGVIAIQAGSDRRYDGPMGKSDRAFIFGALSLSMGFGLRPGIWQPIVIWLLSALTFYTIVNRTRAALAGVK